MTAKSPTPRKAESPFPVGRFTYRVGDASPIAEIDAQGKITLSLDGEVIVTASYRAAGNVIVVTDEGGPYAFPEAGPGKYKWSLSGNTLAFELIEDGAKGRSKSFAVPWMMVE
jgi:hypothetical protein